MSDNGSAGLDDMLSLAYPYALNALDANETRSLEQKLSATDPGTRRVFDDEVRVARETLAHTSATTAAAPPPALRARLLEQIGEPGPPRAANMLGRHRRFGRRSLVLAGTAAAAIAIVAGAAVYQLTRTAPESSQAAPDSATLSADVAGGGTATVSYSKSRAELVAQLSGVPPAPPGRGYQMWLVTGQAPRSAGLVVPASGDPPAGRMVTGVTRGDTFAITVEPVGGSAAPTTKPIVTIALPS